jgi:hypothetical protein
VTSFCQTNICFGAVSTLEGSTSIRRGREVLGAAAAPEASTANVRVGVALAAGNDRNVGGDGV